jgi:hypothetical protein
MTDLDGHSTHIFLVATTTNKQWLSITDIVVTVQDGHHIQFSLALNTMTVQDGHRDFTPLALAQ